MAPDLGAVVWGRAGRELTSSGRQLGGCEHLSRVEQTGGLCSGIFLINPTLDNLAWVPAQPSTVN